MSMMPALSVEVATKVLTEHNVTDEVGVCLCGDTYQIVVDDFARDLVMTDERVENIRKMFIFSHQLERLRHAVREVKEGDGASRSSAPSR